MQIKKAVNLTELALGILILGILVSVGVNILLGVRDARLTSLDTVSTVNESLTFSNNVATLTNTWGSSVTNCVNASNAGVIDTNNYTYSISDIDGTISITNSTNTFSSWRCTYVWYNTSRPDWDLPDDASLGLAEYGNWFTTIVIVGIAGLILALIFMAFGRNSASKVENVGGSY